MVWDQEAELSRLQPAVARMPPGKEPMQGSRGIKDVKFKVGFHGWIPLDPPTPEVHRLCLFHSMA